MIILILQKERKQAQAPYLSVSSCEILAQLLLPLKPLFFLDSQLLIDTFTDIVKLLSTGLLAYITTIF